MEKKKGIQLNQAFGAVLTLVLVAVLVIVAIVIFVELTTSFEGTSTVTITNESTFVTGISIVHANSTDYTIVAAGNCSFASPALTTAWGSYNQTQTDEGIGNLPAGFNVTIPLVNVTMSAAGIINNATIANYSNISASYTYTWGSEACTASENMTTEFGNYTSLVGLVGTIIFLGLVIGVLVASFAFGGREV